MKQATIFKHTVAGMMAGVAGAMLWLLAMGPARYPYLLGLIIPLGVALVLVRSPYRLGLLAFTFLAGGVFLGGWMLVEALTFWENEQGLDLKSVLSVRSVSALVIYFSLSAICQRRAKLNLFQNDEPPSRSQPALD